MYNKESPERSKAKNRLSWGIFIKYFNKLIKKSLFQNVLFYGMIAKGAVNTAITLRFNSFGGKQYGNDNDTKNSGSTRRS